MMSFFCDQFRSKLHEFIDINKGSVNDPWILWEATKGFIRIFSISFASFQQKIHRKKISDLESNLRSLEQANQHTFSDPMAVKIETVRKELNLLYRDRNPDKVIIFKVADLAIYWL